MNTCPEKGCTQTLIKRRIIIDGVIWFEYSCPVHKVVRTVKPDPNESWLNEE